MIGSLLYYVYVYICIRAVASLEVHIIPGVSVALLGTPHRIDLLVVVSPVVVSRGCPVVAVRQTVPIPAPVAGAAPVPVPGPVVPVAGAGQLVPGPRPGGLPSGFPRH